MSYLQYKPMDEEELNRIAQTRVAPMYDEQAALYTQQADKKKADYARRIQELEPAYVRAGQEVGARYEHKRQDVADAAMARGFGRSSYTSDMLARTHDEQGGALAELMREKTAQADKLEASIDALYDELLANQNRLSTAKQNKLLSTIDTLRMQQDARVMEVEKYNQQMSLREQEIAWQREQFAQQMAYNAEKLSLEKSDGDARRKQAQDEFTYKKQSSAQAREDALRMAAEKAALEAAKLSAKKTGGSGGGSKKKGGTGIVVNGVRV